MKILGSKEHGFIVEMTTTEMANLCGKSSDYATLRIMRDGLEKETEPRKLEVGDDIPVAPIFSEANEIAQAHAALNKAMTSAKSAITRVQNAQK